MFEVLPLGLTLGSPIDYLNPGLTGIILDMYPGNPLLSLIYYIWHINWCGPWLVTWKLL